MHKRNKQPFSLITSSAENNHRYSEYIFKWRFSPVAFDCFILKFAHNKFRSFLVFVSKRFMLLFAFSHTYEHTTVGGSTYLQLAQQACHFVLFVEICYVRFRTLQKNLKYL